jgi:hypothetical protein
MTAGLCDTCRHQKLIRSDRGTVFSRCERALTDPEFPKYPTLPVLTCTGYEAREQSGDNAGHERRSIICIGAFFLQLSAK